MTVTTPKRRFDFEIEGVLYEAKELSIHYLLESMTNPEYDSIDNALIDSMGELPDVKLMGRDTRTKMYAEIMKFTFGDTFTAKDRKAIVEAMGLTPEELSSMSSDALGELANILKSRVKKDKVAEKKPSAV